jgi:hypothetical protein
LLPFSSLDRGNFFAILDIKMSSVHAFKAQPAPKLFRATDAFTLITNTTTGATTGGASISTDDVLMNMGTKVAHSSGSTLLKVKVLPVSGGSGTEANSYQTGYISLGEGSVAASAVAALA